MSLGFSLFFHYFWTQTSWVELSEASSVVGTDVVERLLQQSRVLWGLHQYSRSCAPFFPSFSLLPFAVHTHTRRRTLVGLKFHFPYDGLCKTSAEPPNWPLSDRFHCHRNGTAQNPLINLETNHFQQNKTTKIAFLKTKNPRHKIAHCTSRMTPNKFLTACAARAKTKTI